MTDCPLCRASDLIERLYEDDVCWAAYCLSHPDKVLVVLKRHTTTPTGDEFTRLREVAERLRPRGSFDWGHGTIRKHFHLHEC